MLTILLLGTDSAAVRAQRKSWLDKRSYKCAVLNCFQGSTFCPQDMLAFIITFKVGDKYQIKNRKTKQNIFQWQFHTLFCTGIDIKEQQRALTDDKKAEIHESATEVTKRLQ